MNSNNFVALKLPVVIQVVHTLSKYDAECTIAGARSFAGFFGRVLCFVGFFFVFST